MWLGLGGVVLYVLDKAGYFGNLSLSSGTTTTTNAANPNATITNDTLNKMITLMKSYNQDPTSNNYSAYVFNSYYKMVRGVDAPLGVMFPNDDLTTKLYTISEWWTALTGQGLSGLGLIAHHVNPYLSGPRVGAHQVFGSGLAPTGMETYAKYKGVA